MSDPRDMFYVRIGTRPQLGPISAAKVRDMAAGGTIRPQDEVQKVGHTTWHRAGSVKWLFPTPHSPDDEETIPPPLELAEPAAAGEEDGSGYALGVQLPPRRKAKWYVKNGRTILGPLTSSQMRKLAKEGTITADSLVGKGKGNRWGPATNVKGLLPEAGAVPDGESEPDLLMLESAEPAVPWDEDDWAYALQADPPAPPSSELAASSPTSEADDLSVPLGYRRFIDDDGEKKRGKGKVLPNFSVELFGMTINRGTLVVWGLVVGVIVLTVLTCALVSWCPRPSQRLLEARAVALVHVLPTAALVRDDRDGDTLLVKLRLSKRFLRESMGAHNENSAGKDMAFVSQSDVHLVSDDTETTARSFLGTEEKRSPWETPLDPGSPYHVESSLPLLGNSKVEVSGSVKHGDSTTGPSADRGSVTAKVSGDMKGQVTVGPIVHSLSITGLRATRGVDGLSITGRVDGKLSDGIPVSFDFTGDSCNITWSGEWLGFGFVGGSLPAPLGERWYDKTVDVYCVFKRPRSASKLSVRYKDASPISLSSSLAGSQK